MNFNNNLVLRFGKFHDERQRHFEAQYHEADGADLWLSGASESKDGELQSPSRSTSRRFAAVDNTQDSVSEYISSSMLHRATIIVSSGLVGLFAGAVIGEVINIHIRCFDLEFYT